MSSDAVQLWRMQPVRSGQGTPTTDDIDRRHIFPSARQGLDAIMTHGRLGRLSYVGIPDYAGHCVIDFLARRATTVPLRFLPAAHASAVLLYDQWGWQRPPERLAEVRARFAGAPIIWDRVDSLADDPATAARSDAVEGIYQLFSLSKTLGAGGGGLVWHGREGWLTPALEASGVGDALAAWMDSSAVAAVDRVRIDRFLRNEVPAWPPVLRRWLASHSIARACREEAAERRTRLRACRAALDLQLPGWLRRAEAPGAAAPGILPVPVPNADADLPRWIAEESGVEVGFYHFDFSESYLTPEWVRVIAVPLHSEVSLAQLERICARLRATSN